MADEQPWFAIRTRRVYRGHRLVAETVGWEPVKRRISYDTGSSRTLIEWRDGEREWIVPMALHQGGPRP